MPTAALAAGVLLAYLSDGMGLYVTVGIAFLSIPLLWLYLYRPAKTPNSLTDVFLIVQFFILGFANYSLRLEKNKPSFWAHTARDSISSMKIVIADEPYQKNQTIRTTAQVLSLQLKSGKTINATGKFRWVIADNAAIGLDLDRGAICRLYSPPNTWLEYGKEKLRKPDYAPFLERKNLFGYHKSDQSDFEILKPAEPNVLKEIRADLLLKLQSVQSTNGRAMLRALLFGNSADLPNDTFLAFKNTGTLHVLAVSGMHLWLVMGFVTFLLKPIRHLKRIFLGIVLMVVTAYLLLTDLSGSVTRAAFMFLVWWGAEALGRPQSRLNALCATAFLMIAINPFWLFDLGFQLSIAAVTGILLWGPWVSQYIRLNSWWGRELVGSITGTLAATAFTAPILAWYFNALPLWFLPANLLLIPLTSLALFSGLLLLVIPDIIPIIPSVIGWSLSRILDFAELIAKTISSWPGALVYFPDYVLAEAVCFYLFLIILFKGATEAHKPHFWLAAQILSLAIMLRVFSQILAIF